MAAADGAGRAAGGAADAEAALTLQSRGTMRELKRGVASPAFFSGGARMHPSFKEMMNEVVAYGSCCECGSCVLVCPHNVIDYIDGKPKQVAKATRRVRLLRHQRGHRLRRLRAGLPAPRRARVHLRERVFGEPTTPTAGVFGALPARRRGALHRSRRSCARCEDGGVVTAMLAWAAAQRR